MKKLVSESLDESMNNFTKGGDPKASLGVGMFHKRDISNTVNLPELDEEGNEYVNAIDKGILNAVSKVQGPTKIYRILWPTDDTSQTKWNYLDRISKKELTAAEKANPWYKGSSDEEIARMQEIGTDEYFKEFEAKHGLKPKSNKESYPIIDDEGTNYGTVEIIQKPEGTVFYASIDYNENGSYYLGDEKMIKHILDTKPKFLSKPENGIDF